MSAQGACTEPGIICAIKAVADGIFAHPFYAIGGVVILLLCLIGLNSVREHHAEHGLRKTAVKGLGLLRDTGYAFFSTAKFAGVGTAAGVVAAVFAAIATLGHISPSGHGSHGSDAPAAAETHAEGSKALVPVAEIVREAAAKVKPNATTADSSDAVRDAVRFAGELRHRKVEVHFGTIIMIVHPEDGPRDTDTA